MTTDSSGSDESYDPTLNSTRIDLGDDLLEKTATAAGTLRGRRIDDGPPGKTRLPDVESMPPVPADEDSTEEQLKSAKILFGEGLIDEAKRILRQVLIRDPGNAFAKKMLGDIHHRELRQIFGGPAIRRNVYRQEEPAGEDLSAVDSADIMFKLDQELSLGFFAEDGAETAVSELSIFQDSAGLEGFAVRVERELRGSSLEDRIDLGVAFLEMGLHALAVRQFRHALKRADRPLMYSAAALLAYALVLSGHPFDASLVLQPLIKDLEVPLRERLEYFYLMGRAQEMLRRLDAAAEWYLKVREFDAFYRDIEERLRRIGRHGA